MNATGITHTVDITSIIIFFLLILIVAKLFNLTLLPIVHKIIHKTKVSWENLFKRTHFFPWVCNLIPVVLGFGLMPALLNENSVSYVITRRIVIAIIAAFSACVCTAFLRSLHFIYIKTAKETAKRKPIKSYIQLGEIFVWIVAIILIITTLANVSPVGILSGLGAASAVLMLVFKDSIVGFVSSIQLSHNDMVRIGDWIEMPAYNADGTVTDITLQSVKVQNWDNTISTIPIYQLISDSFINWRGMSESGARRIERSIYIDQRSVRFLTREEIERLSKILLLEDYMKKTLAEVIEYNKAHNIPADDDITGKRLTNLGTFRAYTDAYLHSLPQAAPGMTNMVRYLQPNENGLQMEIYLFSADTVWEHYEAIQADIIDHLLAILPEFGLKVFQNPSGADIAALADAIRGK
jgi:miniconductance mechanosensitive channel